MFHVEPGRSWPSPRLPILRCHGEHPPTQRMRPARPVAPPPNRAPGYDVFHVERTCRTRGGAMSGVPRRGSSPGPQPGLGARDGARGWERSSTAADVPRGTARPAFSSGGVLRARPGSTWNRTGQAVQCAFGPVSPTMKPPNGTAGPRMCCSPTRSIHHGGCFAITRATTPHATRRWGPRSTWNASSLPVIVNAPHSRLAVKHHPDALDLSDPTTAITAHSRPIGGPVPRGTHRPAQSPGSPRLLSPGRSLSFVDWRAPCGTSRRVHVHSSGVPRGTTPGASFGNAARRPL